MVDETTRERWAQEDERRRRITPGMDAAVRSIRAYLATRYELRPLRPAPKCPECGRVFGGLGSVLADIETMECPDCHTVFPVEGV